ncbi:MAG: uridine kinase family protein [Elusimicrobiota bacterium]
MGVPNTIIKIVNKEGEVVDFKISKIADSIIPVIMEAEHANRWIAERRGKRYAEIVKNKIYNKFYNIEWLVEDFFKKFVSFKPEERLRRLDNAFVTERLSIVILEKFKENIPGTDVESHKTKLRDFITKELDKTDLKQKFNADLIPRVSEDDKIEIIDFFVEKVVFYSKQELESDQVFPDRNFIMDIIENTLKEIGESEIAEGFMIYREGKNKIRNGEISEAQFTSNGIHYDMCRKTLEWNIEHECENVFSLNRWLYGRDGKDIRTLIKLSEERFINDVMEVAGKIADRRDEIKIIIVAGPSCSNKTTTTVIIDEELSKSGLKLKQLNVDDYFKNLEDQPKDEFGDYDFEMPEAIDIDLLNKHFKKLTRGKSIQKPCYNFKNGKREGSEEFHLEEDEILLIDCLHGLYKRLTSSVPSNNKFKLYIESMNILRNIDGNYTSWSDIRMLKRMMRDAKYRGYSPKKTLGHWPYVRKGELKHIVPYIFATDAVINSGLPYELPVLKKTLETVLPGKDFIMKLRKEGRLDPYVRGIRVHSLLDAIVPLKDLSLVPSHSPIREFIGGSDYVIPHNE